MSPRNDKPVRRLDLQAARGPVSDPGSFPDAMIEMSKVVKTFHNAAGEFVVLKGIDAAFREHEFVSVVWRSGSGKSTLLNILGGLDTPSAGSAFWRDHDLSKAGDAALTRYRRDHVGFVFQFYNLIPSLTVRENVALVTDIVANPMRPSARWRTRSAMPAIAALWVITTAVVPSSALTFALTSRTRLPVA